MKELIRSNRSNYRELLENAEKIVEIDEDLHKSDALLSAMSRQCSFRAIEKKQTNYSKFSRLLKGKGNCISDNVTTVGLAA